MQLAKALCRQDFTEELDEVVAVEYAAACQCRVDEIQPADRLRQRENIVFGCFFINEKLLDLCADVATRQAGRIQCADDGADAATGNDVRTYPQFVQRLEYRDVCQPLRAAAAQRQSDARLPFPVGTAGTGQQGTGSAE